MDDLAIELEVSLTERHGPLITGDPLRQALGFPTLDALRQSVARGAVDVPIFQLEHRRGLYALTRDVARWLAKNRSNAIEKRPWPLKDDGGSP